MVKLNKDLLCLFVLIVSIGSIQQLNAKLYIPKTDEQFYREVSRHKMAVVHFNPYPIDEDNEQLLGRMKDAFVSLAKSDRYKDADVAFIGINLQTIPELADDFNITVPDFAQLDEKEEAEMHILAGGERDEESAAPQEQKKKKEELLSPEEQSTVILFKNGEPLKQDGNVVKRTGFLNKIQLEDFIENYFGTTIDQVLERRKQQERLRYQTRQARPSQTRSARVYSYAADDQYYAPRRSYTYYRRPSYRDYRPYRRAYWGGYGYPYGYWPGFGIGFGFGSRRGGFGFGFGW